MLASDQFQRAMVHFANALYFQPEVLIEVRVSPYLALYKEGEKQSFASKSLLFVRVQKQAAKAKARG